VDIRRAERIQNSKKEIPPDFRLAL